MTLNNGWLVAFALSLSLLGGSAEAHADSTPTAPVRIAGEVHRLERFEREIGRGLFFRLVPDDSGWEIEVGPGNGADNYTDCVNEPLHGITPLQIEGWHFRSDDNTGARNPDDFLTPGIGVKREFQFVLTAEDETKACDDLERMSYIYDEKNPQRIATQDRFGMLAKGSGSFTITAMTLGNLKAGQQAWIESMKFEASFTFRDAAKEDAKSR